MALQVWLPLNGDLTNQGTSNVTFSQWTSGVTVPDNNGKIGKCYINSSHSAGGLISDSPISIGPSQSMFCWFKFTDLESASSLGGGLVNMHRYPKNTGMGITIKYVSATTGYLSVNTGTGSSRTYNSYCGTTLLQANTWYHGGFTYDGSNYLKIYVNGVCENTVGIGQMSCPEDYMTVFCWSTSNNSGRSIHSDYKFSGSINDVRVYDHCLSSKEIEILSRGLVVHYPLSLPMPNFAKGSNTDSTSTNTFIFSEATGGSTRTIEYDGGIPCAKITRNSTAHSSWSYLHYDNWDRAAIKPSTTYTLSFDVIGSGSGSIGFNGFMQGNATNNICSKTQTIQGTFNADKWSHLVFRATTIDDFTDKGTGQTIYMGCGFLHGVNTWIMMKNMKLEEGSNDTPWIPHTSDAGYSTMGLNDTIEYDVSGYNYHGTKTNVTYDSDTPRYATSTKVTTTSGVFSRPSITLDKFTIAFWGKHTASNKMLMGSCPDISTGNTTWYWYGDNSFKYPSGEFYYEHNAGTYTLNTWMHFVATYDGSNIKVYRNGVYEGSKSATGNMTLDYLSVGRGYGSNYAEAGNVSDFRIYATALTPTQIQELYNTAISISNNGTLMGYELVEQ